MLTRWWRLLSSGHPSQAGEGLPPLALTGLLSSKRKAPSGVFLLPYVQRFCSSSRATQAEFPQITAPDRFEALAGIETTGRCFQNVAAGRAGSALGEALAELGCGRGLVEVAAGRLRERAHHLPHLLLRGGTGLGERLLDEHDKLVP